MEKFIDAIETAIKTKNWYAAICVALSIPDICGYLEEPTQGSKLRYEKWYERYMLSKYSSFIGADRTPHTFLSPGDCYALRCALLHEGTDVIMEQRARSALDKFHFIEPPPDAYIHCNQYNNVLQLQVDAFCKDIIEGIRQWVQDTSGNATILSRLVNILTIHPYHDIPGIRFQS